MRTYAFIKAQGHLARTPLRGPLLIKRADKRGRVAHEIIGNGYCFAASVRVDVTNGYCRADLTGVERVLSVDARGVSAQSRRRASDIGKAQVAGSGVENAKISHKSRSVGYA